MYIYYDYEEMVNCSQKLNEILENGITEKKLVEFNNLVSNLNWKGISAEYFRTEVANTISLLQNHLFQLKILANEPERKAELMKSADKSLANQIKVLLWL